MQMLWIYVRILSTLIRMYMAHVGEKSADHETCQINHML